MNETEKKILEVIDKLRPFLINDGGNIEYVKFENGLVYIRLTGQCSNCSLIDYTLKDGIEVALINEVPEVVGVVNVEA